MPFGLGHVEWQFGLTPTCSEHKPGIEFVWFSRGYTTCQTMMVIVISGQVQHFWSLRPVDQYSCRQTLEMGVKGQPHPLAIRRIDNLDSARGEFVGEVEGVGGVVMPGM